MNDCLITILSTCLLVKSPQQQVREWQQGVVPTFVITPQENHVQPIVNWQLKNHTKDNLEGTIGITMR